MSQCSQPPRIARSSAKEFVEPRPRAVSEANTATMAERPADSVEIAHGSMNVFEDLGYPDAKERQCLIPVRRSSARRGPWVAAHDSSARATGPIWPEDSAKSQRPTG